MNNSGFLRIFVRVGAVKRCFGHKDLSFLCSYFGGADLCGLLLFLTFSVLVANPKNYFI